MSIIHEIKQKINLEDLIAESFAVIGKGRTLTTQEHDSLKIRTDYQTWYWYSRNLRGDIFDWWQMLHQCDFRTALEDLAARAGVELTPLSAEEQAELDHARAQTAILEMAARYYHRIMLDPLLGRPGREYCYGRGWTDETIAREQIGYVSDDPALSLPADNKDLSSGASTGSATDSSNGWRTLSGELQAARLMGYPAAQAVLSLPRGHIVYVHRERGRVVYLSSRSIEGKRHYNLPEEMVGGKRPYINEPDQRTGGSNVLVEGQADAISLGQLGVDATALCGLSTKDLRGDFSHVALDNDGAGQAKALELALATDPLCGVVSWPGAPGDEPKDVNEYLVRGATAEIVAADLEDACSALEILAGKIRGEKDTSKRKDLIADFFIHYGALDVLTAMDVRPELIKALGWSMSQFNRMQKTAEKANKDERDSPARYEYSAGGVGGGHLWEQVAWRDEFGDVKVRYAVRHPDGTIKTQNSVDIGSITYIPYPGNMGLINKDVVLFPSRTEEYGDMRDLVEEIQTFIHRYLDIPRFHERLSAYYVVFSWLYDLVENLPYWRALGDYGTGKTRCLQTIGALCYRPMFVSGASTVSPIFRMIDMFKGTLIIDEADFGNSDAEAEIIKIFNVGYYRGGVVLRSEKDPNSEYDEYWPSAKDVFGPKIMATRRPFTDRATESRCLTYRTTTKRPRPGIPFVLGRGFWEEAERIRNRLLLYRLRNYRLITIDHSLADESVEPRLNQVTLALKSIIEDDEMRKEIDDFVRAYNYELIQERGMTVEAMVLQAIVDIHFNPGDLYGDKDFTLQSIAEKAMTYSLSFDPDEKITPKRAGAIVRNALNLTTDSVTSGKFKGRRFVTFNESEMNALMSRYGIKVPDHDPNGAVDVEEDPPKEG